MRQNHGKNSKIKEQWSKIKKNENQGKKSKIKKNEVKSKKRRKIKKINQNPKKRQKTYRKVLNQFWKTKNIEKWLMYIPSNPCRNSLHLIQENCGIKRIFRMSKIVKQYYHHQNTLLAQPTKHMKPQWHSCPY